VTRSYVPLLLALSAIWGSSYMFIKVGLRDFLPAAMVELRLQRSPVKAGLFCLSRKPGIGNCPERGRFTS
jgi:hypothetical protein